MTNPVDQKPISVIDTQVAGPAVYVPIDRLDEVRRMLEAANFRYWHAEYAVGLFGETPVLRFQFARGTPLGAVQSAFDQLA